MKGTRRAFLCIFALHVGVQAGLLSLVPVRYLQPHTRFEVLAVAMSLHERGEFADPYCLPTGPTAHMPPFHPALIAALYGLLGPTLLAGYATWLTSVAAFGVMYGMLPWLAQRLGLPARAGFAGGLAGALIPRYPGYVEPFAGIAIGLMQAAFLGRWSGRHRSGRDSLLLGLAIGLSFHITPALLPVALGLLAFGSCRPGGRPRSVAVLVLAGMLLACVPWTVRNYTSLHGLFFIRSNFGLELRMGNHEGAGPTLAASAAGGTERHPRTDEAEARRVQQLGEVEYMRQARREALAWIRAHPAEFARLAALRGVQFWLGPVDDVPVALGTSLLSVLAALGAWRTWPRLALAQRAALLIPLLSYPLVYLLVGYEPRYRQPLDGLLLLLAATAFVSPIHDGEASAPGT